MKAVRSSSHVLIVPSLSSSSYVFASPVSDRGNIIRQTASLLYLVFITILGVAVFKHITYSEEFVNVFVRIGFGSTIKLVSLDESQVVTFNGDFVYGFRNGDYRTENGGGGFKIEGSLVSYVISASSLLGTWMGCSSSRDFLSIKLLAIFFYNLDKSSICIYPSSPNEIAIASSLVPWFGGIESLGSDFPRSTSVVKVFEASCPDADLECIRVEVMKIGSLVDADTTLLS
ncbi:hypothetical protein Tco_1154536 [Tanacetum coccineum]